jgi:cytidyltransferase-like protein
MLSLSIPLLVSIANERNKMSVLQADNLRSIREIHSSETICLAHGVYDIIHPGHIDHLALAKQLGNVVAVALWSDENVRMRKGATRPIIAAPDRLKIVDALKSVDYVFEVGGIGWADDLMAPVVDSLEPDYYLLNGRHALFNGAAHIEHACGRNTSLVYDLGYEHKINSTTQIVHRIRALE